MDKIDKNGTTIFFFIIILLGIIFGGYYLLNNSNNNKNDNKEFVNNKTKNLINKIDNNKDYIYFINEDIINEEEELVFKDIKFNFDSKDAKEIENNLNIKMNKCIKSVVKNNDEIEKMSSIDYEIFESSKYLSLIVNEYSYNIEEGKDTDEVNYYVFDLYNGKLLSNEDIIKNENVKKDDITKKIKNYIANDESVDKDKTMKNDYYLTINKNGKVILNFIVNSDNKDYNVSIEMD